MKKGKFVVLYGINNLGKTTQAKLLVEKLNSIGRRAKYLKYPVYDVEPSGPMLDEYLRKGNPHKLNPRDAQLIYAFNRAQYEPFRKADLESGIDIIAEDYWGTGVAWGLGTGVESEFLNSINQTFVGQEDLALLFEGRRFIIGVEVGHLHESQDRLAEDVARIHKVLGEKFNWKTINANQAIERVAADVWNEVKNIL